MFFYNIWCLNIMLILYGGIHIQYISSVNESLISTHWGATAILNYFENLTQIEIFRNLTNIDIFRNFSKNRFFFFENYDQNRNFQKILTKFELFSKYGLKSKFPKKSNFSDIFDPVEFFRKFSL